MVSQGKLCLRDFPLPVILTDSLNFTLAHMASNAGMGSSSEIPIDPAILLQAKDVVERMFTPLHLTYYGLSLLFYATPFI